MLEDLCNRPLTFPSIPLGKKETPIDLRRLLYRGSCALRMDVADKAIRAGRLGDVIAERIELVIFAHEFIGAALAGGGSAFTAKAQVKGLVHLWAWAEQANVRLSVSEVQKIYLDWAEGLLHRARVVKDLSDQTAYSYARVVGHVLDGVLDRPTPMLELTRINKPAGRKTPQGAKTDKQNLHETFAFGRLLQGICDALPLSVIWGPRRLSIPLPDGTHFDIHRGRPRPLTEIERKASNLRASEDSGAKYGTTDKSLSHRLRRDLANLRMSAELLMFIGQTGMNLAQAQGLRLRHFSYSSDIDGYKVREYKPRRQGEVLFEIFSEYRNHFERYLAWRRELFPGADLIFPFIRPQVPVDRRPAFRTIQKACKQANIRWTPPGVLRGTRVNWLLRRSSDPDLTAEVAQHSKEVLLQVYEVPSQQRAIGEIARFWLKHDPTLVGTLPLRAVAPGECTGTPTASPTKPEAAPAPDCRRPSGCLWCDHHRDIESLDYVWSLACFRHLKILEKAKHCPPSKLRAAPHPADHAIERLSEKLTWFRDFSAACRGWVEEALARVEEGDYHDQWTHLIAAMEGRTA